MVTLHRLMGGARRHRYPDLLVLGLARRGRCDTALLGNMGKLMRSVVVRNLREALPRGEQPPQERAAPEINVCCHGQDAGDEVQWPTLRVLPLMRLPVPAGAV